MALLIPTDTQAALNIDLTDPNGQALATSLIASAVAYVEGAVGYPLEQATQWTACTSSRNVNTDALLPWGCP